MRKIAWVLIALALLPGCKWFKGKDKQPVDPPAKLVKFERSAEVKKLWSADTGKGIARTGARPRPGYADGRVFVTDFDGGLLAYDAATGKRLWRISDKERLVSGAAARDGLVVAGSIEGTVIAADVGTGKELWRAAASSELLAPPVIVDAVVVVHSNDGRVQGFAAADGKRLWQFDRDVPLLSLRGNAPPIVNAGTVFIGYDNAKVVALRASDGTLLWEQNIARPEGRTELERMVDLDGDMKIVDDVLYAVTYNGGVSAITLDTGRILWTRDMSSYGGLAVSGSVIYAVDTDSQLWALDIRTGGSLWKQDKLLHRALSTPVVVGDYLVVGDLQGYVHWLKREDGDTAERFRLGKKAIWSTPLVVGNRIYVSSIDGHFAAYQLGDG
ncbi:MAG: outer membrane protein assembly factor BamB [Lysobacterales bacterium]